MQRNIPKPQCIYALVYYMGNPINLLANIPEELQQQLLLDKQILRKAFSNDLPISVVEEQKINYVTKGKDLFSEKIFNLFNENSQYLLEKALDSSMIKSKELKKVFYNCSKYNDFNLFKSVLPLLNTSLISNLIKFPINSSQIIKFNSWSNLENQTKTKIKEIMEYSLNKSEKENFSLKIPLIYEDVKIYSFNKEVLILKENTLVFEIKNNELLSNMLMCISNNQNHNIRDIFLRLSIELNRESLNIISNFVAKGVIKIK